MLKSFFVCQTADKLICLSEKTLLVWSDRHVFTTIYCGYATNSSFHLRNHVLYRLHKEQPRDLESSFLSKQNRLLPAVYVWEKRRNSDSQVPAQSLTYKGQQAVPCTGSHITRCQVLNSAGVSDKWLMQKYACYAKCARNYILSLIRNQHFVLQFDFNASIITTSLRCLIVILTLRMLINCLAISWYVRDSCGLKYYLESKY